MLTLSCIGEGAFKCSLNLSPKFLADSPMYSSSHSTLLNLNLYITPLFKDWIFILEGHKEVLDGGSSFQLHFYAIFFASPLVTLTQPLVVWNCYVWFKVHVVIRIKVPVVIIFLLWCCCLVPHLHSIEGTLS